MRRRLVLIAALVAVGALGAPGDDARAAWTPFAPVATPGAGASGEPQVAVDGARNTTVVWVSGNGSSRFIRAAYRPAGGSWQTPVALSMNVADDCAAPRLAVNAAGAAAAVFACTGGTPELRAAYRPVGGTWEVGVPLPAPSTAVGPRVGIDAAGNATALWAATASAGQVQSSYRPPAGPWGPPVLVPPPGTDALNPQIAVAPSGRQTAIWRHDLGASLYSVETAARSGAGAWGGINVLSGTSKGSVGEPQIRWSASEQRVAVWTNVAVGPLAFLQSGWGASAFAGWDAPHATIASADSVEDLTVAIDGSGRSVAVWNSFVNPPGSFRLRWTATPGVTWPAPVDVPGAATTIGAVPQIASTPAGTTTVAFPSAVLGGIAVAQRTASGSATSALLVSPGGSTTGDPQVTTDADGDTVVVWRVSGAGSTNTVQYTVDDVTPAAFTSIAVPAAAQLGSAVAMSATARDSWSSPVSVAWEFGDGASVVGTDVAHAYATVGEKTVAVTATDAVGNVATQSRALTVVAPDAPGGGGSSGLPGNPAPAATKRLVSLGVSVPRQPWKTIKRAHAIGVRCSLDPVGTCAATATVSRAVAKRLHLKIAKRARALRIGNGSVRIAKTRTATSLRVVLTAKARKAIGAATRNVPLTLTVTGSAPGLVPATITKKLTIRR